MTNIDYIETLFPVQAADCVYMERASFVGELILASKWLDLLRCGFRHQVELSKIKSYGPGYVSKSVDPCSGRINLENQ